MKQARKIDDKGFSLVELLVAVAVLGILVSPLLGSLCTDLGLNPASMGDLLRVRPGEKVPVDGVVVDLRNNGGGSLTEAVELSGLFIDRGPVVQVRDAGGRIDVQRDGAAGTAWDGPLAVLVNRASASASEIVAGALQDHGRAVLMGSQTFGKGSVQTLIELEDGSGLKLTIARYFTPRGRSIQEKGITPDVAVSGPDQAGREAIAPREVDLENHFGNDFERRLPARQHLQPAGQGEVEATAKGDEEDYVLKTALDYLRTWQIFKANGATSGKKSL